MKSTNWKQDWMAALIAAACICFNGADVSAQNDDAGATNAMPAPPAEIEATNALGENAAQQIETNIDQKDIYSFKTAFNGRRPSQRRDAVVVFGKDVELKAGQSAEVVVVFGGSAKVQGKVRDAVVAIGGDVKIEGGEVGDAVVAVMGSVNIGPGSKIHGDVVSVGGSTDVADDATVEGHIQPVDLGSFGLPKLDWLKTWLVQCVFKLRPLSLQVGWVWVVAGAFVLLYLLVAIAMPKPVGACVAELTNRPATTFLMGLLAKLLVPLLILILAATGVGVFVVPFLLAALMFGALIGKAAFLEYLGQSVGRGFGVSALTKPLLALLLGAVVITLLYLVPILGLITLAVTGMWGLGAVVLAMFGGARRETPQRPMPPPPPAMPTAPPTAAAPFAGTPTSATVTPSPESGTTPLDNLATSQGAATFPPINQPVGVSEAITFPRAGFWERMGAALLDVILVAILVAIVGHAGPGRGSGPAIFWLVSLAYFAGLWVWKGTTVGGIVLKLKVVRLDGRPVTIVVALVRALAAAFSVVVLFLGFLWIAFDSDKQGWHDKIAGTVVVRQPRSAPLVCL